MNIVVGPGTYVVAVSGGVDSMALLHMLQVLPGLKLTVAHYDHGIRENADFDRQLVQQTAKKYNLPFVYDRGNLGYGASEDAARQARYDFLHQVRQATAAQGIITAHHQDDLLETAMHNLLRGTGRRGLTSLQSTGSLVRPLLHIPKADVINYAKNQGLVWHEDSTNQDLRYTRNHIRHRLMPKLTSEARQKLLERLRRLQDINHELDQQLVHYLHVQTQSQTLDRQDFIRLPHAVAMEVMAAWLRHNGISDYNKRTLERLVVVAKTLRPGQRTDVTRKVFMSIHDSNLSLLSIDR